jgi:hypothetical protein
MALLMSFLTALPILWKIYQELKAAGVEDVSTYLSRLHAATSKLKPGSTPQEKLDAAKAIAEVLRG